VTIGWLVLISGCDSWRTYELASSGNESHIPISVASKDLALDVIPVGFSQKFIRMENSSSHRVLVENVRSSCGCVSGFSSTQFEIAPGEVYELRYELNIKVRDASSGETVSFNQSLFIDASSEGQRWTQEFKMHGVAKPVVIARPSAVDFGDVTATDGMVRKSVVISLIGNCEFIEFTSQSPNCTCIIADSHSPDRFALDVQLNPLRENIGAFVGDVRIHFQSDVGNVELKLPVTACIVPYKKPQ
jgi:hypothetical protein